MKDQETPENKNMLKCREQLYRMMISQLFYDGYHAVAVELNNLIRADPPCPPSDRLMNIFKQANQIEQSKESNLFDDLPCGLDLEFETEGSTLAPEPASYETAYVTSHKQACRAGCFSGDGQLVATGSMDASIKILDVDRMLAKSAPEDMEPGREQHAHPVIRTLYDHTDEVSYLEFHPKDQILASASRDHTVKLFDISKASVKKAHKVLSDCVPVRCIAFHPTGDYMAVGTEHNVLRVYDIHTSQCFVSAIPAQQHNSGITCVRYANTAKVYATGSLDGSIKLWDGVSGRCINTFAQAHDGAEICSVVFTKNGKYLLSSGQDSLVKLWELSTSRCLIAYTGAGTTGKQEHQTQAIFNHTEDYVLFPDEATTSLCAWNSRNASRCHLMSLGHNGASVTTGNAIGIGTVRMFRKDDIFATPQERQRKKIRFRGDLAAHFNRDSVGSGLNGTSGNNRIEEVSSDDDNKRQQNGETAPERPERGSLYDFVRIELTRGYVLEHDEERYSARREKIYSFLKIPRELECFMLYGVLQCADSFLYIYTFLPIRYLLALWALISRPIARCLGFRRPSQRLLAPAEICDLLKGTIWIICSYTLLYVDTNMLYHMIKSQSIIKLYIFYNMLEVGDRLLSAFGQDTIDALFWTATEPKHSKRQHLGTIPHFLFAIVYVTMHSVLVMFQATSLNVAINSNNKGLLTIMMSNNFVELKGSVFKKFDKNNLFQLSCSDVRERFHLSVLMLIVLIQTMKEFSWKPEQFFVMFPDCVYVMFTECVVDWIKHAFITRFNEIPCDVYREYTTSLAYDMTQTRQKHAFSDHSDLVARRMGFIPYPLGVILVKALYHALSFDNAGSIVILLVAFLALLSARVLNTICALGKACDLTQKHQDEKNQSGCNPLTSTPLPNAGRAVGSRATSDTATSPIHRSHAPHSANLIAATTGPVITTLSPCSPQSTPMSVGKSTSSLASSVSSGSTDVLRKTSGLGATALFSNSDVDLDDVKLNDQVLNGSSSGNVDTSGSRNQKEEEENVARSVPDLQQEPGLEKMPGRHPNESVASDGGEGPPHTHHHHHYVRTHKRSESEPSIQLEGGG
uniref:Cleavage stimulation factor subunit 1 n=1 Tax=Anopheles minimus TaxID=112268 RepID=A0A182VRU2_9DIPT